LNGPIRRLWSLTVSSVAFFAQGSAVQQGKNRFDGNGGTRYSQCMNENQDFDNLCVRLKFDEPVKSRDPTAL